MWVMCSVLTPQSSHQLLYIFLLYLLSVHFLCAPEWYFLDYKRIPFMVEGSNAVVGSWQIYFYDQRYYHLGAFYNVIKCDFLQINVHLFVWCILVESYDFFRFVFNLIRQEILLESHSWSYDIFRLMNIKSALLHLIVGRCCRRDMMRHSNAFCADVESLTSCFRWGRRVLYHRWNALDGIFRGGCTNSSDITKCCSTGIINILSIPLYWMRRIPMFKVSSYDSSVC